MPVMLFCSTSNKPASVGQLVHENDVEHDPADREQAEQRTVKRRFPGHLRRHAVHENRDRQRDDQTPDRGPVCLDVEERETSEQHDDRQCRDYRRVDLLPRGS